MNWFGKGTHAALGVLGLSLIFALALNVPVGAVVVFNDGAAHSIPGTDGNIDDIDGGVGANVLDAAGPTPTSLTVLAGGNLIVDDSTNTGANAIGVQVRNTSSFDFAGGTLGAFDLAGGQSAVAIEAFNFATVTLSGPGVVVAQDREGGNAVGILARNNSSIDIQQAGTNFLVQDFNNGSGHAFGIQAVNSPTINVDGMITSQDTGNESARGIQLNNNSSASVTIGSSGILSIGENGNGDAFGIIADGGGNSSTIDFRGSITMIESDGGSAQGIRTNGTSIANLHQGSSIEIGEFGGGEARGVYAQGSSVISILQGANISILLESGNDAGVGVRAEGNSTVNVAGSFLINEQDAGNVRTILANNSSTVNIFSGFSHDTSQNGGGNNRAVVVNNDATVNVFGGNLSNQGTLGGGTFDGLEVNGNGLLNIVALRLPVMLDGNMLDNSSTINLFASDTTGFDSFSLTLSDGTALTNTLNIVGSGAQVVISFVPEPTTVSLGIFGLAALAFRRRRNAA